MIDIITIGTSVIYGVSIGVWNWIEKDYKITKLIWWGSMGGWKWYKEGLLVDIHEE